jgi:hypothetical protein
MARTNCITPSAPSAASATMDMEGSKPSSARTGTCALIAQTMQTMPIPQERRPHQ